MLYWVACRPDEARAVLTKARSSADTVGQRLALDAMASNFELFAGDLAAVLRIVEGPLGTGDAPPTAVWWAATSAAMAAALQGRLTDAAGLVARATVAIAEDQDRSIHVFTIAVPDVTARRLTGELAEAQHRVDHYLELATGAPLGPGLDVARFLAGEVALDRGAVATAASLLGAAVTGFEQFDPAGWRGQALPKLAAALALGGDRSGAARAERQLAEARHPLVQHRRAEEQLALAWAAAATGRRSAALQRARHAVDLAHAGGQHAVEAHARHALVRLGVNDQAAALAELGRAVDGAFVPAMAQHARGLADDDGSLLDSAAEALAGCGALLAAADAAAQAVTAHRRRR